MTLGRYSWINTPLGDVRQVFDRFLAADDAAAQASQWSPRVDIREDDQRFLIVADIPGIDPAQIEISMDKGVLTIKGERAVVADEQAGRFTRKERAHGPFLRRFALPDSVDAEGISASGKHGVLEVAIPKRAESAPRRITINTTH
ncbi:MULTISPECIES: Hsp20/alpha crystallin family protein [Dyella]|uniref:Hsp20/alpha crystallin family protein n=2 Tax=Dyella TaxID=231454 RepID=A0A4R0Z1Y1_9GAMM|nr:MULTISPECIES: Hsp20/alpha crystallin family protein [Dyella]TBR39227.1 Hsp20/alpha crystallin family protein [Dyella terrae]TCI13186.1 Hsp20/alpha crystallin family protein [Dyella soli]